MNKKQLIVAWSNKFLAFILDLIIMIIFVYVLVAILILIRGTFLGTIGFPVSELSDEFKTMLQIIDFIFKIFIILLYFWWIPKKIGNTFGRKILGISDKFNIFWTWPFLRRLDNFPKEHLKKDVILKVIPKNGRWTCPSCNEANLEAHDVCSECGQEVEK